MAEPKYNSKARQWIRYASGGYKNSWGRGELPKKPKK